MILNNISTTLAWLPPWHICGRMFFNVSVLPPTYKLHTYINLTFNIKNDSPYWVIDTFMLGAGNNYDLTSDPWAKHKGAEYCYWYLKALCECKSYPV